jgi:two-component system nitrate/nitrite response regulator NarL
VKRYRVLVVDDSPLARRAVREVLAADRAFEVVGEAADGADALRLARELRPDLVLMDVRLPGLDGIHATARIKEAQPGCKVVMLSVSDDARDLFASIKSGAQGYLLKDLDPEDWTTYLRQILSGEAPISREIATRILQEFAEANPAPGVPLETLSPREQEVLELVAAGLSNREIALRLDIAEGTVKNHLRNILGKLHLRNRTALAAYAARYGKGPAPAPGSRAR